MDLLIEGMERDIRENTMTEVRQFFHLAKVVDAQNEEALDFYLQNGFSINARNGFLRTVAYQIGEIELSFVELLVSKGLNLHVIDIDNQNILFKICLNGRMEIMDYVLSKGVSPKERDTRNRNLFGYAGSQLRSYITPAYLQEKSTNYEDVLSYEEAVLSKNFLLALSIIQNRIARMGGLDKLTDNEDTISGYEVLMNYHDALILNKDYQTATNVLKFAAIVYDEFDFNDPHNAPLGIAATLFTKEQSVARSICRKNKHFTEGMTKNLNTLSTVALLSELESTPSPLRNNLYLDARKLMNREGAGSFISKIFDPVFAEMQVYSANYVTEIESEIEIVDSRGKVKFLFAIGTACMKKADYLSAEYLFRKVINLCYENNYPTPDVFAQSHALIDYIHSQNN